MRTRHTWKLTAEQKADIIRRYQEGQGTTALGRLFGVTEGGILYTLRAAGVPRRQSSEVLHRPLTEAELVGAAPEVRAALDLTEQRLGEYSSAGHAVTLITRRCAACGRADALPVTRVRALLKRGTLKGLCRECYEASGQHWKGRRGAAHPLWRGGRIVEKSGYVSLYAPEHPYARKGLYVFEHRLVMERVLGRSLTPSERIHHKNGVRDDNRPENLELWTSTQPSGVRASEAPHCPTCTCFSGHPQGMA